MTHRHTETITFGTYLVIRAHTHTHTHTHAHTHFDIGTGTRAALEERRGGRGGWRGGSEGGGGVDPPPWQHDSPTYVAPEAPEIFFAHTPGGLWMVVDDDLDPNDDQ